MIKKITAIAVLAMLCLNFWVKAQEPTNNIKALQVGDQLPKSFWLQEHLVYKNGKMNRETLLNYAGKPVIFDFWATWCSSCLKKFKLLDSAASTLNLSVILVNGRNTGDTLEKISRCLTAPENGKIKLPTLIADSLMQIYFPNHLLPHYIWVDSSGRVQAITGTTPLNWESLAMLANARTGKRQPSKLTANAHKQ